MNSFKQLIWLEVKYQKMASMRIFYLNVSMWGNINVSKEMPTGPANCSEANHAPGAPVTHSATSQFNLQFTSAPRKHIRVFISAGMSVLAAMRVLTWWRCLMMRARGCWHEGADGADIKWGWYKGAGQTQQQTRFRHCVRTMTKSCLLLRLSCALISST